MACEIVTTLSREKQRTRVLAWSGKDIILNVWLFIFIVALFGPKSLAWICLLIVGLDIMLAAATFYRKPYVLLNWQRIMVCVIVIIFVLAVIVLPYNIYQHFATAKVTTVDKTTATTVTTATTNAVYTSTTSKASNVTYNSDNHMDMYMVFNLFAVIGIFYYTYFWLMVNLLRKEFLKPPDDNVLPPVGFPDTTMVYPL
jgi:hypothetical protein